jgi:phage-related minor tail protein
MSSASSKPTESSNSLQKNYTISRRFLARQEEIWRLEEELKKLHELQRRDLKKHPFLGNIVGIVRKSSSDKPPEESKKRKPEEDADMAEVASVSSSSTARDRIAKKLAQDRPAVAAAEKARHSEISKAVAQDKF